jgi:hypothetical protein
VARARIALVTVAPLLGELVIHVLAGHLPLELVGTLASRDGLPAFLADCRPDLLLLGLLPGEVDAGAQALCELLPAARILVLAPDGARAWLHVAGAPPQPLAELSVAGLLQALIPCPDPAPPEG